MLNFAFLESKIIYEEIIKENFLHLIKSVILFYKHNICKPNNLFNDYFFQHVLVLLRNFIYLFIYWYAYENLNIFKLVSDL